MSLSGLLWHARVELICRAQFEAAALFDFYRLPEVLSGHQRDADHTFPALYPQTNSPQAWSASAVFCLLQALLGLYPYAPLHLLLVDPHLPVWLPEITLHNLRVGTAVVTICFARRKDGRSDYQLSRKTLSCLCRSPQSRLGGKGKPIMMKHFWYLFAAYTVIWTGICAYVVRLSKKNRELQAELRELQTRVEQCLSQKAGESKPTEV